MRKLTPEQQELFNLISTPLKQETVVAYIANGYKNGKSAYISACKKLKRKESKNCETSASEILSNPNVIEFMDSIKVEAAKEVGIDAAWVLKNAKRVYDRCMQDEPVMANGEPTGEYKFEHSGANKALEIIGKHVDVQAYNEKHTVVEMSHEEWLDSLK